MLTKVLKRVIDLLGAIFALFMLSPLLIIVSVLILVKLGRPILFKQDRGGYKGSVFSLYKFRTMSSQCDANGKLLPDQQRLGTFGATLRKLSIDELPGLYCVIKGEMSLVGPRPFLADYLTLYNERQAKRHDVRPGITGWAQVQGRNSIEWNEKFELDLWYVENWSFFLDVKIVFLTLIKLFRHEDNATSGEVSGSRFLGNAKDA